MMVDNMLNTFHTLLTDDPNSPLNFREVLKNELFRLSLIQVSLHLVWLFMIAP
jgi:ent-kaurene oxidase